MTERIILSCFAIVAMQCTACCQDMAARRKVQFSSFNRSYWTYDTNSNCVNFTTSLQHNSTGINADFATDFMGPCKIDYVTGYNMASDDSTLAYQQLFNGGGNASVRMSLPLFSISGNDTAHKNFIGLVFNPRTNLSLPVTNSAYQGLSVSEDLGIETVFNVSGENKVINLKGVFRSAYTFGGDNYPGQAIAEGNRSFAYQTLSLQLNVRQMYITTLIPLGIWSQGYSNYKLPNYIGLGFRY